MKSKTIMAVAEALGLKYLEDIGEAAGVFNGYFTSIRYSGKFHEGSFSLSQMGQHPSKDLLKLIDKSVKQVSHLNLSGYLVNAVFKNGFTDKGTIQNMIDGIAQLTTHFSENELTNCSEVDGQEENISIYCLSGKCHIYTRNQFDALRLNAEEKRQKEENRGIIGVILGIFGALIGAFVGAIFVFFIARLGYISLYGGVIMGFSTVLGYKLFAGRFGLIGIPVCLAFMGIMAYLVNRLDFSFYLSEGFYGDFNHVLECFQYVRERIQETGEPQVAADYLHNLYLLLAFTLATGALATITTYFTDKKALPSYPVLNESYSIPTAGSYSATPDLSALSGLGEYADSNRDYTSGVGDDTDTNAN